MTVRVRIAPSPTGNLHIGTARTAVFNWLYARRHGGTFVLRIEDTDRERSLPRYTRNILAGLAWLGLDWDEGPIYQSNRIERYREVVQQLLEQGLAYRCYVSEAELEEMRTAQKAAGKAPRYDNRHRYLTEEQRQAYEAEGRQPVIRFKIEEPLEVSWVDLIRGQITWNTQDLGGDMVIARADGYPLYNLAVVVDDLDMAITHVIRGEDHIGNTPKQILLYRALGHEPPQFAHSPLILNPEGKKLSKRDGATSVAEFQQMGFLPEALKNYLALLSWSPPDGEEIFSFEKAATLFDFDRVTRSAARFDWDKLNWINSQYIKQLSPPELVERLSPFWQAAGLELATVPDPAWLEDVARLIGDGIDRLTDAPSLSRFLLQESLSYTLPALEQLRIPGVAEAMTAMAEALQTVTSVKVTVETLKPLVDQVAKTQGLKKGLLLKSLRAALTGDLQGPDLMESFVLLQRRGWALGRLQAVQKLVA
ncbi:glutamate--tRNA ligase [Thermostichus vulcanus]|uniref:Glutamate--tRNA ligase n=1 Tax=Thermostichus vulcanus str. 'Rupite' TaxID=2813851 RepID=A0ABT0CD21_THEVL|nr:glutamate--tRNA ligase [Thermostichus vulcanus str. 'Rupite']